MNSRLLMKNYNSEIKIYYKDSLPYSLAQEIINFKWTNQHHSAESSRFELVQETKAKVYRFNFNNEVYYMKSYAFRSISKIIKNLFRPIEAVRCFKMAISLSNAHFAVAEPVLALTRSKNMFFSESIFVTKEVPGVDLYTYLFSNDNINDLELRKKIIKKIALLWSNLTNHNIVHLDPGLDNLIVSPTKEDIQIQLIDIDNMYSLPFLPKRLLLIKNLSRLSSRFGAFDANELETNVFIQEFCKRCYTFKEPDLRLITSHLFKN